MSGPGEGQLPITVHDLHALRDSAIKAVHSGDPHHPEFIRCVANPLLIIALVNMLERGDFPRQEA